MTQSILGSLDQSVTRIHDKAASQHRSGMSTKKKVGLVAAGLALVGGVAAIGTIAYRRNAIERSTPYIQDEFGDNAPTRRIRLSGRGTWNGAAPMA